MYYFEYCFAFVSSQSVLPVPVIQERFGCQKGLIPFSSFWLIVLEMFL
jgi:hypothetical protein